MSRRQSIWEWALAYTGDPASWQPRGELILAFLRDEGMTARSDVLELGCGNLSLGNPLIRFLDPGRYVGVDPQGWLVEAALERYPDLLERDPQFSWRDDFNLAPLDRTFDFAVAHSVLSHVAHWQMELLLARVREVMREGAVMLASLRLSDRNSFAEQWQYPGVSYFRLDTLRVLGFHAGWHVEAMPQLRARLADACPNDFHDWVRFTAVPSAADQNMLRLAEEARQHDERELADAARDVLRQREQERLDALAAAAAEEEGSSE